MLEELRKVPELGKAPGAPDSAHAQTPQLLHRRHEVIALRDDPAIVHFIGRNKPWKATAVHPRTAEWRSLVSTDAFPGWQPETRSTSEKIRGRLRKGFNGLLGR